MMMPSAASQDPSQGAGERGDLMQMSSKETPGSPDASELGSPRSVPNFDLLNMVVSYKRMVLFLEPVIDAVELTRFLLGCVSIQDVFVCDLSEHQTKYMLLALSNSSNNSAKVHLCWTIQKQRSFPVSRLTCRIKFYLHFGCSDIQFPVSAIFCLQ